MKKLVSTIVTVILAASVFTACSNENNTVEAGEKKEVNYGRSNYGVGVEFQTGNYWFDENGNSKPIYRKVINITDLPSTDASTRDFGNTTISEPIDELVSMEVKIISPTGTVRFLPHVNSYNVKYSVSSSFVNSTIEIGSYSDLSTWTGRAVLEYTKTTD